ncbi:hypothetical protein GCM10025779_27720 [Arthrobacter cryoconiti]
MPKAGSLKADGPASNESIDRRRYRCLHPRRKRPEGIGGAESLVRRVRITRDGTTLPEAPEGRFVTSSGHGASTPPDRSRELMSTSPSRAPCRVSAGSAVGLSAQLQGWTTFESFLRLSDQSLNGQNAPGNN